MKPGKMLDKFLAENVLKWKKEHSLLIPPNGKVLLNGKQKQEFPPFSTNIASAFDLISQLKEKGIHFRMLEDLTSIPTKPCWYALFEELRDGTDGVSPAHAICLAALSATGFGYLLED